ncbi:MAG: PAS domain S-box protein [Desulfovibrionaceae bacterium]
MTLLLSLGGGVSLVIMLLQYFLTKHLLHRFLKAPFDAMNEMVGGYRVDGSGEQRMVAPYEEFAPLLETLERMGETIREQIGEIRDNEERFRAIFNNAPIGIFRTTFQGQGVEANPALRRTLGCTSDEEYEDYKRDFVSYGYRSPEMRQPFLDALLATPEGVTLEMRLKRTDGTELDVLMHASLQFDAQGKPSHIDGIVEDITHRKLRQELLRQSEQKFASLFKYSPDAIVLEDFETRRYVDVNDAFTRLLGITREEALGRTPFELGIFPDPRVSEDMVKVIEEHGRLANHMAVIGTRSGPRAVSVTAEAIEIGEQRYFLAVVRDETERRMMQELMVQTEKMVSLGGIAAGIAHEINNPLGIILQAAGSIAQRLDPDLRKNKAAAGELGLDLELVGGYFERRGILDLLEEIDAAAVRASNIIRHMLDFSRRSESHREPRELESVLENALLLARSDYDLKKQYDFKKIEIIRDYAEPRGRVNCSETEIEQVFLNLLRNAAQAMAESSSNGPGQRITLRTSVEGGMVRVEIADNGPGIPEDVRRRIFEPFFSTKAPGKGTGLGLSVSYFIVTKGHGGELCVAPAPGGGTVFTVSLPAYEQGANDHE